MTVGLDNRLEEELARLAPADPSGALERIVEKRVGRQIRRKAGVVALAVGVIAGTVGGFYGLTRVFGPGGGEAASGPANGLIVFSDIRVEGGGGQGLEVVDDWHLYTLDPDSGQITRIGPDLVDEAIFPTWSPDGSQIAFVGYDDPADGGPVGSIYVAERDGTGAREVFRPADGWYVEGLRWSPDGGRIGYQLANGTGNSPVPASDQVWAIWSMAPDGTDHRQVTVVGREMHFSWSPDGSRIVFERFERVADPHQLGAITDLYIVDADGGSETRLTFDGMSRDPAWSPDGEQIAFSHGPRGDQHVALIDVDGSNLVELAARPEAGTFFPYGNTVLWAPDGRSIAFWSHAADDTCSISTIDPADGAVRLLISAPADEACPGQNGMSWAPAVRPTDEGPGLTGPSGTPIPPSGVTGPEPTGSTLPEGAVDIGIGFPACFAVELGGIDLLGDGTEGTAWTAVPVRNDGQCPEFPGPQDYLLAVDHTADRLADSWIELPFECYQGCVPAAATDLDANGSEELVVANLFSIVDFWFFALRTDPNGELALESIVVAEPGHEPAGVVAGEPLRIDAWGDAGYGSAIRCEGYPEDPVIVWSWSYAPIESNDPTEVHITRLQLQDDGLFHVVGTNDSTVPAGEPTGLPYQGDLGRECGVGWGS